MVDLSSQRSTRPPAVPEQPQQLRSTEVNLALASIAAMLGGLGLMSWVADEQAKEGRPLYVSKDECEREWSDQDCEPVRGGGSSGGHGGGRYHGPSVRGYTVDKEGKAHRTDVDVDRVPPNSRAMMVDRGGFGHTGGRFGASS
jgi:uncharacterized protein YgiB involved in biofilm formation